MRPRMRRPVSRSNSMECQGQMSTRPSRTQANRQVGVGGCDEGAADGARADGALLVGTAFAVGTEAVVQAEHGDFDVAVLAQRPAGRGLICIRRHNADARPSGDGYGDRQLEEAAGGFAHDVALELGVEWACS